MVSLMDLQKQQKRHDEQYHRDIYFLSHQERFKHVTFHFGKYTGRIARMMKNLNSTGLDGINAELQKTLTDSFIIVLNTAEIFGLDLDRGLTDRLQLKSAEKNMRVLAGLIRENIPDKYSSLGSSQGSDLLLRLLLEYADTAHVFHKACDSLDHMEGVERERITSALLDLLTIIILSGDTIGMDFEATIPRRWRQIEESKVL